MNYVAGARVYQYLKKAEGLRLKADRRDGTWTVGYGHTQGVGPQTKCTEVQAEAWLLDDVELRERCVKAVVTVPLTPGQFDALVSWTFNCGAGKLAHSNGLVALNKKQYAAAWDLHFALYTHDAAGAVEPGLVARRIAEGVWWHEAS